MPNEIQKMPTGTLWNKINVELKLNVIPGSWLVFNHPNQVRKSGRKKIISFVQEKVNIKSGRKKIPLLYFLMKS